MSRWAWLLVGYKGLSNNALLISPSERKRVVRAAVERLTDYAHASGDSSAAKEWQLELANPELFDSQTAD